jgi:hypothetical protein
MDSQVAMRLSLRDLVAVHGEVVTEGGTDGISGRPKRLFLWFQTYV